MPTYELLCKDCNITFEKIMGMNDIHAGECPSCDRITNNLVYSPFTIIDATPHTLGGLSDSRKNNMGKYEYSDTIQKMANDRKQLSTYKGCIPDGAQIMEKKDFKRPWWRPDSDYPDAKLARLLEPKNEVKAFEYVLEGKTPNV